nr:hypothetical protein [Tanacetum cinerariifolium]
MELGVMIRVIKHRRSLLTLLSWLFHLQALLLIMRNQPSGEYHVVPPPITGNFMLPKPDLVFHTAFIAIETAYSAFNVQLSPAKPARDISHATRLMAPIIEDWVSDSEDESEPNDPQMLTKSKPVSVTAARPVSTAVPKIMGNPQYASKDKGVIDSGCSRHMIGNMFYLSDFQELNGGYVSFGGNPKGGKISGKGKIKIDFKLPDESQVLLRVPRENNVLTRTRNYQPVTIGNQSNPNAGFQEEFDAEKAREEASQQYILFPVWSTGSLNPINKEGDATFDGKEHDAEKPESAVNLSPSSSAQLRRQDDMTKKKDKGKSHVEYFTENRDFNANFEDYSKDSSNNVRAAGPIVPTAWQNYSNITNPISVVGPLNSTTSPTHGQSSLRDAS